MEGRPPRVAGAILLGLSLILLAVLISWYRGAAEPVPAGRPALVGVAIQPPDGSAFFEATGIEVSADNATVLGALQAAGRLGNFSVVVTYQYFGEPFVTQIGSYSNEGACGWVWALNGREGDRSAGKAPVVTGDVVVWHWGCQS